MLESVNRLLQRYESGRLTRRELLAGIALLSGATVSSAQGSVLRARNLNHVNVRVTDVPRSEAFYRKVFGLPANRPVIGAAFALDLPGGGFISLCPVTTKTCGANEEGRPGEIDHFAIGVENFDAAKVVAKLKTAGISAEESGGSVWIKDPDGTTCSSQLPQRDFRRSDQLSQTPTPRNRVSRAGRIRSTP